MTRLSDAFSLMPNPADSYTLDHEPSRAELADWCDRVKEELIVYARFRYGATAFADIAPIDEQELRTYLEDALSEATAPAWRKLR
jgi:DNA-directed RNA polymerase subunit F